MEKYRLTEGIGAYFVTFTVVEWLPVLIRDTPCQLRYHDRGNILGKRLT